jgi:hypothetical protein
MPSAIAARENDWKSTAHGARGSDAGGGRFDVLEFRRPARASDIEGLRGEDVAADAAEEVPVGEAGGVGLEERRYEIDAAADVLALGNVY